MKKERENKVLIFTISIMVITLILATFVLADDTAKIKKAYTWLQSKSVSRWPSLTTKQHVFSLLAQKDKLSTSQIDSSIRALTTKSYDNGTCWPGPEANCNTVETALAKIALFSVGKNQEKANEWLSNRTIPALPLEASWYLQITSQTGSDLECLISYDNQENQIRIYSNGSASTNAGECLSKESFWLKIANEDCMKKNYNLSCNDSMLTNFLFTRTSQGQTEWYVNGENKQAEPLETITVNLTSYCASQSQSSSSCDYESSLWTAYAFFIAGQQETAKSFLPYLIMESKNNKKYLPEVFLYKITGKESYANQASRLQGTDGLFLATNTAYNKYYDTGLATWMLPEEKMNKTKLKQRLLIEQKQDGSWSCEGQNCENIRDTALLLLGVWSSYSLLSECQQQGFTCVTNCTTAGGTPESYSCSEGRGECCDLGSLSCEERNGICKQTCSSDEAQVSYSCSSGTGHCCKNNSISLCVSEINGKICSLGQECINNLGNIIQFITSSDATRCCLGNCTTSSQTCSELPVPGEVCDPNEGNSCPTARQLNAIEPCCEQGYCVHGLLTCSQQGTRCASDEDCKDGTFVIASDTNNQSTCCIQGGRCVPQTCPATAQQCQQDENCVGNSYETSDAAVCCEGSCLKTCLALGGSPCNSSMNCKGQLTVSFDFQRCCIGTCKQKNKFNPTILIVIIIIFVLALGIFFFIKKKKKGTGKEKEKSEEFNFILPKNMPPTDFAQRAKAPTLPTPKPRLQPQLQPQTKQIQLQKPQQETQQQVKQPQQLKQLQKLKQPTIQTPKMPKKESQGTGIEELDKTLEKLKKMNK